MPLAIPLPDLRPYASLVLLFLPLIIQHARRLYHSLTVPSRHPPPQPLPPTTRRLWHTLLFLHTLYTLLLLTLARPHNIFTSLHAPLSAPVSALHTILRLAPGSVPAHVAAPHVLRLLQSAPTRSAYVRFGHAAIAACTYCEHPADYELFALSGRTVSYALEAAWGMLLAGGWTRRHECRPMLLTLLAALLVGETYVLRNVEVDIDAGSSIMWHDTLWLARQTIFLLLPLSLPLLPPAPPPQPAPLLHLLPRLDTLSQHLTFLRLQRSSIPRSPSLRAALTSFWEQDARSRTAAWEDPALREKAEELGLPLAQDGPVWQAGKGAVHRVWHMAGLPMLKDADEALEGEDVVVRRR
ncbi:hypothetical protein CALVIDRAFT_26877 [Calocera viscosa TUFC12733]|uniref:Uncharacterized protein n=1 Tax=Calocera viscosa (strain TUFC12733) TaxID=1330018 RepID=A0A167P915_CALVF|nr:hypothetical protein CALVIDRAFT_26877 [Calocera viscosa TUFC12733]